MGPSPRHPGSDTDVNTGAGKELTQARSLDPHAACPSRSCGSGLRTVALTTTSSKMLCSCVSIGTIEPRPPGEPGDRRVRARVGKNGEEGRSHQQEAAALSVTSFGARRMSPPGAYPLPAPSEICNPGCWFRLWR